MSRTSGSSLPPTQKPSPTPTVAALPPVKPFIELEAEDFEKPAVIVPTSAAPASPYKGSGTAEDPYIVVWLEGEKEDPYNWSKGYKWFQTAITAIDTLCIAFASAAYSGAAGQITARFKVSTEIIILGVSLFVLGFGIGPLMWAPLSEMYGRRNIFLVSFAPFTLLHIGGACATNIETIIITRFFAGSFGSAPLTNSGGTIADMWSARERGTASALFALAPFLGPVLGPIVGGFTGQTGWENVFWVMFGFAAVMFIISAIFVPETYAPVLLRRKAAKLQKESNGEVRYMSAMDYANTKTTAEIFKISMTRPFVLLFKEPIVLALSIYCAIIYGILYMFFAAFPIIFQKYRHWSSGIGGLAFLGVGGGMVLGTALSPIWNRFYIRAMMASPTGRAPPEARLPGAILGSVLLPVGLFWFAWTCTPDIHWSSSVLAGIPFGFGLITIFSGIISYLIEVYLLYAASALAANAVMRSILGCVFPLITRFMYEDLGLHWAGSLAGFLALACMPMPFLFYRYGEKIRSYSKFSPTAAAPKAPTPAAGSAEPPAPVVEKVPQPSIDTALEPEYGPEAGMPEQEARERREELERTKGDNIV